MVCRALYKSRRLDSLASKTCIILLEGIKHFGVKLMIYRESGLWPRFADRGLSFSRRPLLMIMAFVAFSAACSASEAPASSAVYLLSAPSFCEQGCAVADLDGDGRPDLAIAEAEGWGPSGFQYRIDLKLTTGAGLSSFSVFAQRGGLRIIPRDVNGDWEPDLVISSAWSFAPVGVWINDGHGGFFPSDRTFYPLSELNEAPGTLSSSSRETFQAAVPQSSRHWPDSFECHSSYNELVLKRLPLPASPAEPTSGSTRRPQTRSPPFLSTDSQDSRQELKLAM